ncbi:MAG: hypothetical protein NWF00_03285 [Candidatus Bathyarchaeota archaeon]|nr:hypothetical protein [Candidatus Bathyarchaeota archaeon]
MGENFEDAFSKALQSAEFCMPPQQGSVLVTVGVMNQNGVLYCWLRLLKR